MCCNSAEDLEVFTPSDNLPHKHTRWNLKISRNFFFFFFAVRFQAFQFFRRGFKNCTAGAKQARGGEGWGRKARKGKREEVPSSISLIPSLFFFLPLPFLSLRRRFEEAAWYKSSNYSHSYKSRRVTILRAPSGSSLLDLYGPQGNSLGPLYALANKFAVFSQVYSTTGKQVSFFRNATSAAEALSWLSSLFNQTQLMR